MRKLTVNNRILLVLTFIVTGCFTSVNAEQCEIRSNSAQIYISDTHVGMGGRCTSGDECRDGWHNMEDFRWHADFELFVEYLLAKVDTTIDFVVVGDFLELWQDPDGRFECGEPTQRRSDLGCSAEQAIGRVNEVGNKHPTFFAMLSKLIAGNDNRVIILPGNHDAVLVMPLVANTLTNLFDSDVSTKVCIDQDGMLYHDSNTHKTLIEHGHQVKGDLNRYASPTNGVVECLDKNENSIDCNDDGAHVRRSWGENFVQNYYNNYEKVFPIIDNYSAEGSGLPDGLKRGLKASTPKERSSAFVRFASFFFTKQTSQHVGSLLGDEQTITRICIENDNDPCLDLKAMMGKSTSDGIFSQLPRGQSELLKLVFDVSVESQPTLDDVYRQYADDTSLIDELVVTTCIYWDKNEESEIQCPYRNRPLGAIGTKISQWFKGIIDSDFDKIKDHVSQREELLSTTIDTFIFGHTHEAMVANDIDDGKIVLNTGAWQRVASARVIADRIEDCTINNGISDEECFQRMSPNALPACYSPVANIAGEGPNLYWWAKAADGSSGKFLMFKHGKQPNYCRA